jgi:hypothetical protein
LIADRPGRRGAAGLCGSSGWRGCSGLLAWTGLRLYALLIGSVVHDIAAKS